MPSTDDSADRPRDRSAGADPGAGRGVDVARREIRDDEAARLLGLLSTDALPSRAARWVADGVVDDAARRLAAGDAGDALDEEARLGLLARLAVAQGVAFDSVRDARAHHAQVVIAGMTAETAGADSLTFSNSFTDAVSASARGALGRLFSRRRS